jgi:hypothetical protein
MSLCWHGIARANPLRPCSGPSIRTGGMFIGGMTTSTIRGGSCLSSQQEGRIGSPGGFPLPAPTPPYMRVRVRRFLAVLGDRAALLLCHDGRCPAAQPVGVNAPGQDHRWSCRPAKFSPSRVVSPSGLSRLVALGTTASADSCSRTATISGHRPHRYRRARATGLPE